MRRSKGRAEPSQGQPCPVAPRPGHPLPSPRSHPESRAPRRDPRAQPPVRACCRGEPAFAAGGTSGVEQRPAGHEEVGAENPRRESRGRAALPGPPRGLRRALEERRAAARGGRAAAWTAHWRRLPAPGRFLRSVCVKPPGASGWRGMSVARIQSGAGNSDVGLRVGAPCSSRRSQLRFQAPGFRLSMQVAGTGACCPEWLEELRELREEAPQVFLPNTRARPEGLASQPPHCGCQGGVE